MSTNPALLTQVKTLLKPILPSKYHFELHLPIIFVCTRVGEVGSALFSSGPAAEETDISLSSAESLEILKYLHSPDATKYITISGRKFVLCSCSTDADGGGAWFHGRCVSSSRHRGGVILSTFPGGLALVCVYEMPMTFFDAMSVAGEVEKVLSRTSLNPVSLVGM